MAYLDLDFWFLNSLFNLLPMCVCVCFREGEVVGIIGGFIEGLSLSFPRPVVSPVLHLTHLEFNGSSEHYY